MVLDMDMAAVILELSSTLSFHWSYIFLFILTWIVDYRTYESALLSFTFYFEVHIWTWSLERWKRKSSVQGISFLKQEPTSLETSDIKTLEGYIYVSTMITNVMFEWVSLWNRWQSVNWRSFWVSTRLEIRHQFHKVMHTQQLTCLMINSVI